jgi:hypothetical protein
MDVTQCYINRLNHYMAPKPVLALGANVKPEKVAESTWATLEVPRSDTESTTGCCVRVAKEGEKKFIQGKSEKM